MDSLLYDYFRSTLWLYAALSLARRQQPSVMSPKRFLNNFRSGPATRGHSRAVPPKSLLLPSLSEDCTLKKKTGSVPLECSSGSETPQNTGHHPRIRGQEPFFRRYSDKNPFFVWSSPLNSWNFVHISR